MKINENLVQKISTLNEDKQDVLTLLLESIEDGLAQTRIEDRIKNEIREIIQEGDQL